MLPSLRWRFDAILRLLVGVFVCMYAGSVLATLVAAPHLKLKANALSIVLIAVTALLFLGTTLVLLNRPWKLEGFMRKLVFAMLCFYAGMLLGAWAQKLSGPSRMTAGQVSIAALSFHGAVLVLTVRLLREHQARWTDAFGFDQSRRRAVLAGVCGACLFMPIGWALQHLSATAVEHLGRWGIKGGEQEAVKILRAASSPLDCINLGLVTIVLAPLAEEVLFRGILYTWVKQLGYPRLALWGTAIVFAFVHFNVPIFLPLVVLACLLTFLYERTSNLLAPIAAHCTFNALNFILLLVAQNT